MCVWSDRLGQAGPQIAYEQTAQLGAYAAVSSAVAVNDSTRVLPNTVDVVTRSPAAARQVVSRHELGARPVSRLKARLNASSES